MRRRSQLGDRSPLLIAFLCVVALGLAGATLTSATAPAQGDRNFGPDPVIDRGDQSDLDRSTNGGTGRAQETYVDLQVCISFLTSPLAVLGIVAGLGLVVALVGRYFTTAAGVIVGLVLVPPVSITYFLVTNCSPGAGTGGGPNLPESVGGLGGGTVASPLPTWAVVALLFAVVVVGGSVVFWRASGDETYDLPEDDRAEETVDAADLAEAASDAADRIEAADADVDNEIYRAWYEMTALLQIPTPETSTAGDFAEAAVEAGMAEEDVRRLTRLFEDVRYGGEKPSAEREQRAIDILRRIESQYRDDATDAPDDESGPERSANGSDPSDGPDREGS